MTPVIDTAKVKQRRQLRFESLDEIAAEVERLAAAKQIRTLGNWSSGQVLQHLAATMDGSIDGFEPFVPAPMKFLLRLFMKGRFLNKPMPAGFQLPKRAGSLHPAPKSWETALENFRRSMRRLKTEVRRSPHPAFGPMTADEWEKIHCRHSELHLSFLQPVDN
jgi:hypothetical protein